MIEYIHVEPANHDVIGAEGAAAESFVDDGSRAPVDNAAESAPGRLPTRRCAPLLHAGAAPHDLRGRLARRAGPTPPVTLRGFIDEASPAGFRAWAQNPLHPAAPVCLDLLIDGDLATWALANRYRPDLEQAGLGSGHHAFAIPAPAAVTDGTARIAEIRRSSDGAPLGRSPWVMRAA